MLPALRINGLVSSTTVHRKWNTIITLFLYLIVLCSDVTGQMRQLYVDPVDPDNDIKKISLYSYSEGYIAFSKWIGYTIDSGRTFTRKYITMSNVDFNSHPVNLTFGFGITGVKAFNKDTLIVYGDYGGVPAILYSADQANTFKLVYHSQLNNGRITNGITDLAFLQNNNIGFAVEADRIIKSFDRGKSWVIVRLDPESYFERINFADNNTVYVSNKEFSNRKLLKTTNGGLTWTSVAVPLAGSISAVSFISGNKGWLSMYDAYVRITYYTSNGGVTWRALTNPLAVAASFIDMTFINDSTGYALEGGYEVLKTTDSGKVWQPLFRDNDYSYLNYGHRYIFTIGNDYVWAGGMHGFLELSSNGGSHPIPKAFFIVDTANYLTTGIVRLKNFSSSDYQFNWFVNDQLIANTFDASYHHDITSFKDSVKLIVTNTLGVSDTVMKYVYFPEMKFPSITSFSPAAAGAGSQVTIHGTNFTGVTAVKFGESPAASFSIVSDNMIIAVVNDGATGAVSVMNSYSSASSAGFSFLAGPLSPPPVITAVTPAYGNIGTAITISGNNFGSGVAKNLVYFGTTKAMVTAATTTQISCIVPAGAIYSDISVQNLSTSLKGISSKPFSVTFADSTNLTSKSFRIVQNLPWGSSTSFSFGFINVGDLDGDGKTDLIGSADVLKNLLLIYRNTSQGKDITFSPRHEVAMKAAGNKREIFDIDGDGKPDIVNLDGSTVNVIRNISTPGNIAFESNISIPNTQQSGPLDLALDDLDGDGRVDIAVAGYSNKTMSVLKNTSWPGLISFSPGIGYSYGSNSNALPDQIAIADMDGDSKKDIIVLNFRYEQGKCSISFFKNKSNQTAIDFDDKIDFEVKGGATQMNSLLLRDYDMDGKPDVIICNDNYLQVLVNTSTGGAFSLASPVDFSAQQWQMGASIANLTGGVRPDLVTGNFSRNKFSFFRNISTPGSIKNDPTSNLEGFDVSSSYVTAVADFNGDARPDVVGSSYNRGVVVLENSVGKSLETRACIGSGITLSADVEGSTWQWQLDAGAGFVNITDNTNHQGTNTGSLLITGIQGAWNNYKYRCIVGNFKSSIYQLKVTGAVKPHVTISTPSLLFCKNGPVTFSATSLTDGGRPIYHWQINEITVLYGHPEDPAITFTTSALGNKDRVRVIVHSGDMCSLSQKDTSEVLTMVEHGRVPAVSIEGPSDVTCAGSSATFVATPLNGGSSPSYQWRINGSNVGDNSPVLTANLPGEAEVKVVMTSNSSECNIVGNVTSNVLRPVVYNNLKNAISIRYGSVPVCKDQPIAIFSYQGAGADAKLEWQVDDVTVAGNSWYFNATGLADGSRIKLLRTTSRPCTLPITAESNIIYLQTIPSTVPSVSINGNTLVTDGQSTVLTAMPVNGGSKPKFLWEDSVSNGWQPIGGETTNPSLTFKPTITGHKIRCTMKSNADCASMTRITSSPVTFTIQAVTGINAVSPDEYGINYFPNPASATLTIDKLRISDLWETLEIRSVSGKLEMIISARNKTTLHVPVRQLAQGFYIVVLHGKPGAAVYMKLLKM